MKKKIIFAGATLLLATAAVTVYSTSNKSSISDLLNANVEALAESESQGLMKYVCSYIGCCGGPDKCFSGEVSYGGVTVSGTFYMR